MARSLTLHYPQPVLSHHHEHNHNYHPPIRLNPKTTLTRRSLLLSSSSLSLATIPSPPSPAASPPLDTTITDRVFIDFSLCPTTTFPSTPTSEASNNPLCSDSLPLGRVILGLYGHLVPLTVSNFKSMCSSSYKNTLVHKIFPGQFFLAGRQGRREKAEVRPPLDLPRNTETVESKAFMLTHSRAGVVSLCLSENDDDDDIKLDPNYRNVEFLITTGPGPCPQLDNKNIVFGTVLEGLDVVAAIAAIPTYKPGERIRQFNDLAEFLGDGRAQNARAIWNRPLETTHYVLLLCSFKEQLQQHVRVHAMEAVMACWELEQSLQSLTGVSPGEGTGATMSDNEDEQVDSDTNLFDASLDGADSLGFGPLIPTESERSLMERVRQELKQELKQGYKEKIVDVREEILRKRRAGKLPGDTTSLLKAWWQSHSKWPYPTEEDKARLVQETGLQLKQINNWFINQRKRNWHINPSPSTVLKSKRKSNAGETSKQ